MSGRYLIGVEHAGDVGNEVGAAVAGASQLVGDRTPGVAVVIADHEPSATREQLTEVFLPPEHRRADAHDEQDRRVNRVAERLRAQLDTVRLDHSLAHPPPLLS